MLGCTVCFAYFVFDLKVLSKFYVYFKFYTFVYFLQCNYNITA